MIDRHPDFDTLGALADGSLKPPRAAIVTRHAEGCPRCAGQLAALRALLAGARELPASVEPPAELWAGVRGAIDAPRELAPASRHTRRGNPWRLAAAAVVVAVASSAITYVATRPAPPRRITATAAAPSPHAGDQPGSLAAIDADYAAASDELQRALAAERSRLTPETVATVERSLRTVDSAIAEVRHALAADPGNRMLGEILAANYEHKLQLLRRAAELPASL